MIEQVTEIWLFAAKRHRYVAVGRRAPRRGTHGKLETKRTRTTEWCRRLSSDLNYLHHYVVSCMNRLVPWVPRSRRPTAIDLDGFAVESDGRGDKQVKAMLVPSRSTLAGGAA